MTRAELTDAISKLETAINTLAEPDKSEKKIELSTFKIQLQGMALDDITGRLARLSVDRADMQAKIAAANEANRAHEERVAMIDGIFDKLTGALGLVI